MSFLSSYANIGYGGDFRNTVATQQGIVVLNGRVDFERYFNLMKFNENTEKTGFYPFYPLPLNEYNYEIHQGDILCRAVDPSDAKLYNTKRRRTRYDGSILDNGAPKIFGSLNGAGVFNTHNPAEDPLRKLPNDTAKKAFIRSNFEFVGVAQNDHSFAKGGLQESSKRADLSVQIGGINTMINTGMDTIVTGQEVMWDVPETTAEQLKAYHPRTRVSVGGKSKTQVQFATVPYVPGNVISAKELYAEHKSLMADVAVADAVRLERIMRQVLDLSNPPVSNDMFTLKQYYYDLVRFTFSILRGAGLAGAAALTSAGVQAAIEHHSIFDAAAPGATESFKATLALLDTMAFAKEKVLQHDAAREPDRKTLYNAFPRFLNSAFALQNEARSRVIGRALTSAAPGHQFDMVLAMNRTV